MGLNCMKEINIKEMPTKMSQISFAKYLDMVNIVDINKDNLQMASDLLVSYWLGITIVELNGIKREDYESIITIIKAILDEEIQEKVIPVFTHDKTTYGFVTSLEGLSYGEYIDLDKYSSTREDWHRALAILYRPVTEVKSRGLFKKTYDRYEIEEYQGTFKYADIMKEIPANIGMTAMLFFYHIANDLLKYSVISLSKQMVENMEPKMKQTLELATDGILACIQLLEETYYPWTRLKN